MDFIHTYINILLPLIIINLILVIISLKDILKNNKYKFGNRIIWVCVVIFIQIIGPISYLLFGRDE
ncbi:PLD nuclease N-terminal domain-containing protein [Peptostreptococcus stomatis]|uniref:PLD nuclease N-terminal domain-containing protein n=1 Tax=Peptostreptococcus stomatis TaxID=341694 RepID=UPI00058E86E7|nr:PLD nuclease N-terminal domain-containing protein [Peptostreptococcus stomatis]